MRSVVLGLLVGLVAASVVPLAANAAPQTGGSVQSSAEVANDPPMNVRVAMKNDEDAGKAGVQVAPGPDGKAKLKIEGSAEDGNGWKDLRDATVQVYLPDDTPLAAPETADPAPQGQGRERKYHHDVDIPAEAPPGLYRVVLTVADEHAQQNVGELRFELRGYLAVAVDATSLSFGDALAPGATSHASPVAVSIRNVGTVPMDLRVSSDGLAHEGGGATLGPERIRYSSSPDMANELSLSMTGILDAAWALDPTGAKLAYFDLHMPTGDEQYVPAGRYVGSITLGGVAR